jgi:hypothetical protein
MGKKSNKTANKTVAAMHITKAPVLYINDPTTGLPHARYVRDMIPACNLIFNSPNEVLLEMSPLEVRVNKGEMLTADLRNGDLDGSVAIIGDGLEDSKTDGKIAMARHVRVEAIKHGCNFASINLYHEQGTPAEDKDLWGTNHLELGITNMSVKEVAEKIYHWLCMYYRS